MNWLLSLLFPHMERTVRIRSGHLPGLKAPTVAPKIPRKPQAENQQASNIHRMYKRYKATHPNPPEKRSKSDRGVDF
jgi:hypothetical protein